MTTPIPPRIWTYQDGDVYRIADDKGRRYYVEGRLWFLGRGALRAVA